MSGISVSVKSNLDEFLAELAATSVSVSEKATVRALNKAADRVMTASSRTIRAAGYNLKAATIKRQLRKELARPGNLRAVVKASGKPIPMIEYVIGDRTPARRNVVKVRVLEGTKSLDHAFIARLPTGHIAVLARKPGVEGDNQAGKPNRRHWRYERTRQLFGPSVPGVFVSAKVSQALDKIVEEQWPKLLAHETEWLTRRK